MSFRAIEHGSPALATISSSLATNLFGGSFYNSMIAPLAIGTAVLAWSSVPRATDWPEGFSRFMACYLGGWTLSVAADWLQGPYVYALYEAYGYSQAEIAQLFVAGFGAAMVGSCFVGSLADTFGRKKGCIAYCLLYILSCVTKHWKNYWVLMIGRITGGFATSLLFSCFECWMVSEHLVRHKFSSNLLSYMFGMKFTLMYLVAITSGFVAQVGVSSFPFQSIDGTLHVGGNIVAFDMSAGVLIVALLVIAFAWDENFGQMATEGDVEETRVTEAAASRTWNLELVLLGLAITCLEGSMYCFVFNWTPSLETPAETPPHGVVFAMMMMACMCGASTTTLISNKLSATQRLQVLALGSVLAFSIAGLTAGRHPHVCFLCFLLFEFCVGIYFPSMGTLKSLLVPERIRATVYNIYRVPLNAIVVSLLLTNIGAMYCFRICSLLCAVVFVVALGLRHESPPCKAE